MKFKIFLAIFWQFIVWKCKKWVFFPKHELICPLPPSWTKNQIFYICALNVHLVFQLTTSFSAISNFLRRCTQYMKLNNSSSSSFLYGTKSNFFWPIPKWEQNRQGKGWKKVTFVTLGGRGGGSAPTRCHIWGKKSKFGKQQVIFGPLNIEFGVQKGDFRVTLGVVCQ